MKTIIYILIAVFVFGMIAVGFKPQASQPKKITLQCTDSRPSKESLEKSAAIITKRLNNYHSGTFKLSILPEKNQLQLSLADSWDLSVATALATEKGALGFFETINRQELTAMLKGDPGFLSMLNVKAGDESAGRLGCLPKADIMKMNQQLPTSSLGGKCMFAWEKAKGDSMACLYALKVSGNGSAPITGADIVSMELQNMQDKRDAAIFITFSEPAASIWAELTRQSIGRDVAIVLDGTVLSAPMVRDEIKNGKSMITGNFTPNELRYIVAIGNGGELPFSFSMVQ